MSFPWVIVMVLGGLLVYWALGQLGLRPSDKASG